MTTLILPIIKYVNLLDYLEKYCSLNLLLCVFFSLTISLQFDMFPSQTDTKELSDDSDGPVIECMETAVENINKGSAMLVVLVALRVNSIHNITLKGHLIHLAKKVGVKTRALGKYEMMVPLAIQLIKKNWVVSVDRDFELNFSNIKRHQIRFVSLACNEPRASISPSPSDNYVE